MLWESPNVANRFTARPLDARASATSRRASSVRRSKPTPSERFARAWATAVATSALTSGTSNVIWGRISALSRSPR